MMALADVSLYVTVLASIGPVALAVTTNLNINFLRRPAPRDLISECRLLKLGNRLAVGEVRFFPRARRRPSLMSRALIQFHLAEIYEVL